MSTPRDRFQVDGQCLDHWFVDPWTGEAKHHRYWLPNQGGYVRVDRSPGLTHPGTLGEQPTTSTGSTWRASTIGQVKAMVKAARRRDRAAYRRA